jgi:hypothetical protein
MPGDFVGRVSYHGLTMLNSTNPRTPARNVAGSDTVILRGTALADVIDMASAKAWRKFAESPRRSGTEFSGKKPR